MEENCSVFALVTDLFESPKFETVSEFRDRIKHLRDRLLGKHRAPFRQAQDADRVASE